MAQAHRQCCEHDGGPVTSNIILHGDSRVMIPQHVTRPINAIITDPPYGVDFVSNSVRRQQDSRKYARAVANDSDPNTAIDLFASVMKQILPRCAAQCEMYVFTNWNVLDLWMPRLRRMPDFELKMMLIWSKGYPGLGDVEANWGCGHEIILYMKKGRRLLPYRRSGILHVERLATKKNVHPTEKPVQLIETLVKMSTDPADYVIDPFSGSGSTSLACKNLGRDSIAFDVDEEYVKVGNARLAEGSLFDDA